MCSAHTHLSLKFICCWLNHTQKGFLCWMGIQSCPSHVSFMYVKGPPHQKEPRTRQQEWQRHGFLGRSRHVKMKVPGCVPAVPFSWPLLAWPGWGDTLWWAVLFLLFQFEDFFFYEVFFINQSTNQLSLYGELKPHCIRQAVTWFMTIFPILSLQSCTVANCWLLKMFLTYMWFSFPLSYFCVFKGIKR